MAIDDVIMIENSSAMSDEMLAHRLGMVPLTTDLDRYVLPEDCTCESEFGCNKCRVILTLDADPGDSTVTVYSRDIQSEDPNTHPVQGEIPLVKLVKGQRIRFEAYARLGKGKDHARWQPVAGCSYKYLPNIRIYSRRCNLCGDCVEACSKNILSIKDDRLVTNDLTECTLCEACVQACKIKSPAIKVEPDKDSYIFQIESTGALPIDRLIVKGTEILTEKTKIFLEQLKENTS
jgi:DNA-directed RNA polymerase subunit D